MTLLSSLDILRSALSSQRPIAWAAMLFYVFASMSTAIDSASHTHQICPEHGEEIHEQANHSSAPRTDSLGFTAIGDTSAELLSHEHCRFSTALRGPQIGSATPIDSCNFALFLSPELALFHDPGSSIPLYRLAPKTSPPV